MENNTFKGSLFGGFRRQDVMDYIEKASRESAELLQSQEERIHALEKELQELRSQRDQLQDSLKDATASYQATQDELDAAQASYADINEALTTAQQFSRRDADEIRELKAKIDALQPEVEEYHHLKNNIAEVELDARHRAETMTAEAKARAEALLSQARSKADALTADAKAKAEKTLSEANISAAAVRQKADQHALLTRQQLNAILNSCQNQYHALLDSYKSSALQAATALQKAQESMTQLPAAFDKISEGLQKLSTKEKKDSQL